MILAKVRDPRLVTIRRGGTFEHSDHRLLALCAATCAEYVLDLFESVRPGDRRPPAAVEHARAWVRGEVTMMEARAAGVHAMGAARELRGGCTRRDERGCGATRVPMAAGPAGRTRSASSSSMTRGCAMRSAGLSSTADGTHGEEG